MQKTFFLVLGFLSISAFCFSEEVSQSDTLAMINAQALLGQSIVIKLNESLNLREARIAESELDLSLREKNYDERIFALAVRESNLDAREIDLGEREKRSEQIEQISNGLTKSLTKLENSQKFTNGLLIGTVTLAVLEGIFLLVR